jgi:hypothetical protein
MQTSFLLHLIHQACEIPTVYPSPPTIPHPEQFLTVVLYNLAKYKISRHGLDKMIDTLMFHKDFIPLLQRPLKYQNNVIVPDALTAHWLHIIVPAWEQHADIRRIIDEAISRREVISNSWI